jgi:hypothetical protein
MRVVRLEPVNEFCSRLLVQAVETIVRQSTVDEVVGTRVCDISAERVERALDDAREPSVVSDSMGSL